MSIVFDENLDLFCLETANTSYIIGLADHRTFVRSEERRVGKEC